MLAEKAEVEAVINVSRGELENVSTRPLRSVQGYRVTFDVKSIGEGAAPIDLRMYLRLGRQALSETWLYQWSPTAAT